MTDTPARTANEIFADFTRDLTLADIDTLSIALLKLAIGASAGAVLTACESAAIAVHIDELSHDGEVEADPYVFGTGDELCTNPDCTTPHYAA